MTAPLADLPNAGGPVRDTAVAPTRRRTSHHRVPFIQQLGADDCGATCLAMVLAAHEVHDVAAECRALCGSGRDGVRLRALGAMAERFGLIAQAVSVAADDFATLTLPAIAHWKSRHFVVVEQWTRKAVTIIDPAIGRQTMTPSEFAASYSGVALVCEPGPGMVTSKKRRVPLWLDYLAAMFHDLSAQGALAQIVTGSVLLQALGLAMPLFTKVVVDDVAPPGSALSLSLVALGMMLVVVARAVTTFVRSAVMLRLQARLDVRLTEGFFDHLLRLPYRFYQGRSSGDLLMRLSSNTMIRDILTTQLLSVMLDGPFALLYLAVLLAIAPTFALLVVGLSVAQAALVLVSLQPLRDLGQRMLAAKSDEQSCLVELMKGIAHLKASGAEEHAYERWMELFRRQLAVFVERGYFTAKVDIALGILRSAAPLALLWYGASLVVAGALPVGTMLALAALAASFLTPFMALVQSSQQLQLLDAYVERLIDVLQAQPESRKSAPAIQIVPPPRRGAIEARGLTFRFSPEGPAVIDDVSFSVAPGEMLGLVGATGSGKSTILMLLLGLYEPTGGEVVHDGIPLSEHDPHSVRKRCGVVLQDVALFGGSIRSNISLNEPTASLERVVWAARLAGFDDDVERMPMRYETRLAESGANLSGGQRQRLAIARALLSRPDILLLDEASSHLDVAAEQRLIANLEGLRCTRVVIAHRLTAVRSADQILMLQHGRVVERGTHEDLIARDGAYAALASAQASLVSGRRPGADRILARGHWMEPHGHRGWRASI